MSGNPFRRSLAPNTKLPNVESASSTPSFGAGNAGGDALTAPAQPGTKKKRVKIQTPPDSPEFVYSPDHGGRRLSASDSAGRAESPPPPTPTFRKNGAEESDSTTTADSDLEEALKNTRRNSGSLPPLGGVASASGMRAPYNPFARTLATSERNAPRNGSVEVTGVDQKAGAGAGAGAGRPALDVDQFKNILMTGSAVPSSHTAAATTAGAAISQPRPPDSSSNSTDTSSIFDPTYGVHPESPRHSLDDYEDASDSERDDDTEHSNLMGEGRLDDLAPPAPPKPQKPRGPQTVSFADFDQTIPPDFQSTQRARSPANPQITGILRPPMQRSSSDLNKPLPPPPRSPVDPSPPSVPAKDASTPQQVSSATPVVSEDSSLKKAPPPPPTRRKAGDPGRPRSSSNLSNTESINSVATGGSGSQPPLSQKTDDSAGKLAPPPPPPARKTQPTNQSSTPTIEAPPKETSPSHSTDEVPKAAPAPPPRRHASNASRGTPSRSPSDSGRPNLRPGDAFLSALTPANANAPPAPPPRRAGGSKRTSLDGPPETLARRLSTENHRRSSNNSLDSDRSSLQRVPEPEEYSEQAVVSPPADPQRDILADMSAFQAEIDALRAKNETTR